MKKTAIAATTTLGLVLAGAGYLLAGSAGDTELRRVDCQALTMFTPAQTRSAEDLCANYGGVALKDAAPSKEGLVILVRNQPMGGFHGENPLR